MKKKLVVLWFIFQTFLSVDAQIIADHTIVDHYDKIPQEYIDSVKRMLVTMSGESHSSGYRHGAVLLEEMDNTFQAETFSNNPMPPGTDQHLRIGRQFIMGEEYVFVQDRIDQLKSSITTQYEAGNPMHVMGFAWCWDMTDDNPPGGMEDTVYQVRWAGRTEGSPDGNMRWGLDSADQVLTGNNICMDTYLEAVESYNLYCEENTYPTTWIFTTGPVDYHGGTENGFQREIKHDYIRSYVAQDTSRILFDYADILCWSDSGDKHLELWNDEDSIRAHAQIHPDNMMDYDASWNLIAHSEDGDHIGEVGAVRLAKAMWWMLARMAGWEGYKVLVDSISLGPAGELTGVVSGDTVQFSAFVWPVEATDTSVRWSIREISGTATIDDQGILIAGMPGEVEIEASANDDSGASGTYLLEIIPISVPIAGIEIVFDEEATDLEVGDSLQLSAIVSPSNASNPGVLWHCKSSQNNPGLGSITEDGLFLALEEGNVDVVAVAQDSSGVSNHITLTILGPSAVGVDTSEPLLIYPNPGGGHFFLHAGGHVVKSIKVFNVHGVLVLDQKLDRRAQIIELDLSRKQTGLYYIQVHAHERYMVSPIILTR